MAQIEILRIKKGNSNTWYTLPAPMTIITGSRVLDSVNSGRDNGTGYMYREIVRDDVATYSCTLPAGLTNVEMKEILDIILSDSFNMRIPDIRKGCFTETREFYCSSAQPEIEKIITYGTTTQTCSYTCKEFTFEAVEL